MYNARMDIMHALLWGVGGTFIVQLFLFVRAVERCHKLPWDSPDEAPFWQWLIIALGYAAIAAFVVCLLHSMGQVNTPWAAFITGVGADRFIDNALKQTHPEVRKRPKGSA